MLYYWPLQINVLNEIFSYTMTCFKEEPSHQRVQKLQPTASRKRYKFCTLEDFIKK